MRHILDGLLAQILKRRVDPILHGIVDCLRDGHAFRRPQCLQPGSDVHAVAIDRAVLLLDYIAQVQADSKAHALRGRESRGLRQEMLLYPQGGQHCAACGVERRQDRVARCIDDAP